MQGPAKVVWDRSGQGSLWAHTESAGWRGVSRAVLGEGQLVQMAGNVFQ